MSNRAERRRQEREAAAVEGFDRAVVCPKCSHSTRGPLYKGICLSCARFLHDAERDYAQRAGAENYRRFQDEYDRLFGKLDTTPPPGPLELPIRPSEYGRSVEVPNDFPMPYDPPPPSPAPLRDGVSDPTGDIARRVRQVKQVTRQDGSRRDKSIENCRVKLELRNGETRNIDDTPWELAEARLAELVIAHGQEVATCGCVMMDEHRHATRGTPYCDAPAVVLTVFGNVRFPFCEPCAKAALRRDGINVLDWLPDDI